MCHLSPSFCCHLVVCTLFLTLHSLCRISDRSILMQVIQYIQFLQEKLQMYEGSCQGWSSESTKCLPLVKFYMLLCISFDAENVRLICLPHLPHSPYTHTYGILKNRNCYSFSKLAVQENFLYVRCLLVMSIPISSSNTIW